MEIEVKCEKIASIYVSSWNTNAAMHVQDAAKLNSPRCLENLITLNYGLLKGVNREVLCKVTFS